MTLPKVPGRTTPSFGFSYIERSLKDCLRKRQFGKEEKRQVSGFFARWEPQPSCVFCGSCDVKRWDHLVPVSQNGATVLGNMVLACAQCDDSKGGRSFDEWMVSDVPKSPLNRGIPTIKQRVERIKSYIKASGYVAEPLAKGLTTSELQRLAQIRIRLDILRKETDSLIADYRSRTGNN